MANLYHVNRDTKKFLGAVTQAFINPKYSVGTHSISDKYIYNAKLSTLITPPIVKEDEAAILISNKWNIVIDKIGQHYCTKDGVKHYITSFDEDVPDDAIQIDPPTKYHTTHDGTNWIEDTTLKQVDEASLQREQEIEAAKTVGGLKGDVTLIQAHNKIDSLFENATTVDSLRVAVIKAFKLLVVYIIK